MDFRIIIPFLCLFNLVLSVYTPIGDVVEIGSVLLPATRRGRYLANIVSRQAIDGTGIKFNQDADRMNAEAKKKVDVLSEELLPYIISEQERRTTLHKRVMTAVQNGEKGVTIAEMRNRPPLIIKRGLLYRCPTNRAPLEPDGSGTIMCEQDVEPSPIVYDSCLSAEDRDLYTAGDKYFFCNRHKIEGPELPRNGSTVVGCAPHERTSLSYTRTQCALEDSDDVVVHFRYYPDKTYKFVQELDPDHEMCDHWNPCQLGYIFSLASADQAHLATDLWPDFVDNKADYEKDEFVEAVMDSVKVKASDFINEYHNSPEYKSSLRRVNIPKGMEYTHVECRKIYWKGDTFHDKKPIIGKYQFKSDEKYLYPEIRIPKDDVHAMSEYRIHWTNPNNNEKQVSEPFLMLIRSDMTVGVDANNVTVELATGQVGGKYNIAFEAKGFRIKHVRLRSTGDWKVYNVDPRQWKITHDSDTGNGFVHLELDVMTKKDFGSYFLVVDDTEGNEEKHMFLKLKSVERDVKKLLPTSKIQVSYEVGALITANVSYGCAECVLVNVLRNGESVFPSPQVQLLKPDSVIFSFPSFEDENAGTYKGLIKKKKTLYEKILAVIENSSPDVTIEMNTVTPPEEGQKFEQEIKYTCANTCTVEKVIANGIKLKISGDSELNLDEPETTPAPSTSMVYEVSPTSITIRAGEFSDEYSGMCQAVFRMEDGTTITKNILDIVDKLGLRMDGKARRSEATSGKRIVNVTGEDLVTTHATIAINITTGRVTTERTTELITSNSETTEGATMKVPADNAKTEDTGKVTTDNITTESDSEPVATGPPTSTNEKITSTLAE